MSVVVIHRAWTQNIPSQNRHQTEALPPTMGKQRQSLWLCQPTSTPHHSYRLLSTSNIDVGNSTQYEAEVADSCRQSSSGFGFRWEAYQILPCGDMTPRSCRYVSSQRKPQYTATEGYYSLHDRYRHDGDQILKIQIARRAAHTSTCWPYCTWCNCPDK